MSYHNGSGEKSLYLDPNHILPWNFRNRTSRPGKHEYLNSKISGFIPLFIISVVIAMTNGLLCWLFFRRTQLREKPENGLFCSQARADLLKLGYIVIHVLEQTRLITEISPFIGNYIVFIDLFGLVTVTFDRYWSVTKPLQRRKLFNQRLLMVELVLVWILPLGPSLAHLTKTRYLKEEKLNKIVHCLLMSLVCFFLSLSLFLHLIVYLKVRKITQKDPNARASSYRTQREITVTQCRTNTVDRNKRDKPNRQSRITKEIKLAKMTFIMLLLYLAGHLPTIGLNLASIFRGYRLVTNFPVQFSLYSFLFNSVFNPLLCIFVKRDFTSAFRDSFTCCNCPCQAET